MNSNRKKLGFTIAEVMVVILILTIIFAAFAPLITSKKDQLQQTKVLFGLGTVQALQLDQWTHILMPETQIIPEPQSLVSLPNLKKISAQE